VQNYNFFLVYLHKRTTKHFQDNENLNICFCIYTLTADFDGADGGDYLSQVTTAISIKNWDGAVELFSKRLRPNAFKSEMYYLTQVDKSSAVCHRLAFQLASFYQKTRNYDMLFCFTKS
jgi:hypothetical protein